MNKINCLCIICFLLIFIFPDSALSEEGQDAESEKPITINELYALCGKIQDLEECDTDLCSVRYNQESTRQICLPRTCEELPADHCPEDKCRVLDGCHDRKVCYPKDRTLSPSCGGLGYGGEVECCEGYVKKCGIEFFDGSCDMVGEYSLDSIPFCIPCGNGVCNQFENRCNCPEDCK